MNSSLGQTHKFQIMALDGGGIRGVFTAAILAAIEEDYHVDVTEHFDLIAGTSTGGIVAIALGLGIRPKDIVQFYLEHGADIFRNPIGLRWVLHWFYRKYPSEALERALKEILGERLFGESKTRLIIPSFNLDAGDVYIFRTPHKADLRRDFKVPAWRVAMATSAAPTYFPAARQVDGLRLVDGGVWANNPSLVALVEAVGSLQIPQHEVALLSIGTLSALRRYRNGLDQAGKFGWAARAPDLILDATSVGVVKQLRFLLGPDRFYRVTALTHEDDVSLDQLTTVPNLIAKAAHISRKELPMIASMFLGHRADAYQPLHVVSK